MSETSQLKSVNKVDPLVYKYTHLVGPSGTSREISEKWRALLQPIAKEGKQLREGSTGSDRPCPAKWNILHAFNCLRTLSLRLVGVTGSNLSCGQRFFNVSISLVVNERILFVCISGVSCIATKRARSNGGPVDF